MTMQTYKLEIDYKKAVRDNLGVGFEPKFPYKPRMELVNAKNMDNLRAALFSKYLNRTGTCIVYNVTGGKSRFLGKALNYGRGEIYWEVGDSGWLTNVDPKTGKLRRD